MTAKPPAHPWKQLPSGAASDLRELRRSRRCSSWGYDTQCKNKSLPPGCVTWFCLPTLQTFPKSNPQGSLSPVQTCPLWSTPNIWRRLGLDSSYILNILEPWYHPIRWRIFQGFHKFQFLAITMNAFTVSLAGTWRFTSGPLTLWRYRCTCVKGEHCLGLSCNTV